MTGRRPRRAKPKGAEYHHGDLRKSLMLEAVALMRERGSPDELSMRELARRLGVTYGAPHHHFAERDDLFAAIAEESFAEVMARGQRRLDSVGDVTPVERLRIVTRSYLDFALAEPTRYAVMFLPQLRDRTRFASLHATGGLALDMLGAAFAAVGTAPEAAYARAVACWATLHGFAVLVNERFLDETRESVKRLAADVLEVSIAPPRGPYLPG
jgi:AcrR family transcriptional regulator